MNDQPSPLTQVILGFLTPLMQTAGLADTNLARQAAQEAIAACPPGPLITTAQTIAFAIAALDSLRLAAPPEVALTTKLRLRSNANALSRSSLRSATTHAPRPLADKPRPQPPPPEAPRPNQAVTLAWADAMTDIAAECARDLVKLPPKQRHAEVIRINILNATASQIRQAATQQPAEAATGTRSRSSFEPASPSFQQACSATSSGQTKIKGTAAAGSPPRSEPVRQAQV